MSKPQGRSNVQKSSGDKCHKKPQGRHLRGARAQATGCASHFGNPTNFKILKEQLLVQKQTLHQRKGLVFSFEITP